MFKFNMDFLLSSGWLFLGLNGEEKGPWRTRRCSGRESPRQGTCNGRPLIVCQWCTAESAHTWAATEPSLLMVICFPNQYYPLLRRIDTNKGKELKRLIIPAQRSLALCGLNRCRVIRSVFREEEARSGESHKTIQVDLIGSEETLSSAQFTWVIVMKSALVMYSLGLKDCDMHKLSNI